MITRNLSSSELTFRSFQHSQGRGDAQLAIFGFMASQFSLGPDVDLSDAAMQRYKAYITGSEKCLHIPSSTLDNTRSALSLVKESLRTVDAISRPNTDSDKSVWVEKFVDRILTQELALLNQADGWALPPPWIKDEGRVMRRAHRIAAGKASFLYFYGKDGNTTGFREFNRLYENAWEVYEAASNNPKDHAMGPKILDHMEAVSSTTVATLSSVAIHHSTE